MWKQCRLTFFPLTPPLIRNHILLTLEDYHMIESKNTIKLRLISHLHRYLVLFSTHTFLPTQPFYFSWLGVSSLVYSNDWGTYWALACVFDLASHFQHNRYPSRQLAYFISGASLLNRSWELSLTRILVNQHFCFAYFYGSIKQPLLWKSTV